MKRNKLVTLCFLAAIALTSILFSTPSGIKKTANQTPTRHREEGNLEAINALQFISTSRSFPNPEMPADAYGKAFQNYKNNYCHQQNSRTAEGKSMQSGSWTNFGPNNIGGRTISIAIDPTDTAIIYLGSASGGLWKSTTGGIGVNAWTYIHTGFEVLGVSSIAINPNNHNELFIGTGETYSYGTSLNGLVDRTTRGCAGIGILKSINGGVTWTQSLNWNFQQNRCVWDIIYNPLLPTTLYAATTEGVFKTTNGGTSWALVLAQQMVTSMVIHKVDTGTVYAGVGNLNSINKGLYKTINSGTSWAIVGGGLPANTQNGRIIISNYSTNNDVMMCEVCNNFSTVGIYRSTNKGVTWNSVTPFSEVASWQGWYARGLLMQPGNNNNVLVGGVQLFKSVSFGDNINQVSNLDTQYAHYLHSDIHNIIANPLAPNKVYILTDGGLFRSNDFGDTYYECTDGYITSQMYIGSVSATNSSNVLAGLQDNYTVEYLGSVYWYGIIGGDGSYNAIDFNNDQIQYASFQYLNVYQTMDQWAFTYNQIVSSPSNPNGGNPAAFLAPFVISPSNTSVLYGGSDTLFVSTDQGMNFNPIGPLPFDNGNAILSISVSSFSTDTLYCTTVPNGTSNTCNIFRTFNGGNTFTNVTGTLPNRYPRRITVNPRNTHEVYIAYSGFGTGHLYKSINDGHTWTDISVPSMDIPFHCITVDPLIPNNLYAGCDFGVFFSNDDGATWSALDTGFPETVMVFDLVISPSDRKLLAFTHGHGAYKIDLPLPVNVHSDESFITAVSIYPNPVKDELTISLTNLQSGMVSLSIYNMDGKLISDKKENLNQGKTLVTMDVSSYPNGTYFMYINDGGQKINKKIVVMR